MYSLDLQRARPPRLEALQRNHYFYGMLLDEFHFTRETEYLNKKIQLLTRLVLGYGVVVGLDVVLGSEDDKVRVMPGMAIDKWGRIIVVPQPTDYLTIPPELIQKPPEDSQSTGRQNRQGRGQNREKSDHHWISVELCYRECPADPAPVLAGDCDTAEACEPSTILESYQITFSHHLHERPHTDCRLRDLVHHGELDHDRICDFVTNQDGDPARNGCIPIANIRVETGKGHHCDDDNIDICVRPIVYTNDLLYEMILSLISEDNPK